MESEADSGLSSRESFARFDHGSCLPRTRQRSLLGGFIEFSETFPRWGTVLGGELFRLPTPSGLVELRRSITNGNGSGSSRKMPTPNTEGSRSDGELKLLFAACDSKEEFKLRSSEFADGRSPTPREFAASAVRAPTPTVCGNYNVKGASATSGDGLATFMLKAPSPTASQRGDCPSERERHSPSLVSFVNMEPLKVPTLHGVSKDGKSNGPSGNELGRAVNRLERYGKSVLAQTPTSHNAKECNAPAEATRNTPTLTNVATEMQKHSVVPTPTASDNRDRGHLGSSAMDRRAEIGKQLPLSACVSEVSGSLNPDWVEWLMNFPIGWSSLTEPVRPGWPSLEWWYQEPEGVPRVAKGVKNRGKRLIVIGNGQCPLAAAIAWLILSGHDFS